jgi:hypothetical protein
VSEEMMAIEENLEIAMLSVGENDRVSATGTMQRVTEMLGEVESILLGESTVEMEWEEYSSEEDYDYDMEEEEIYVRHEKEKHKAVKGGNGKKGKI